MYEQFKARAEGVSAEIFRFGSRSEALSCILDFLASEGVADRPGSYAVWAGCPFTAGDDVQRLRQCPGLKLEVTRELAAAAKIGIRDRKSVV